MAWFATAGRRGGPSGDEFFRATGSRRGAGLALACSETLEVKWNVLP